MSDKFEFIKVEMTRNGSTVEIQITDRTGLTGKYKFEKKTLMGFVGQLIRGKFEKIFYLKEKKE